MSACRPRRQRDTGQVIVLSRATASGKAVAAVTGTARRSGQQGLMPGLSGCRTRKKVCLRGRQAAAGVTAGLRLFLFRKTWGIVKATSF